MQISKLLPAVALATWCATLPAVHAADNPAQAAARKALEQKLANPNAPTPAPAPAPAPKLAPAPAPKPAPALTSKPASAPATKPVPAPVAKPVPAPATKPTPAPAPAKAAAPVVKAAQPKASVPASKATTKVASTPAPINANGDNPAQAAARQALAKKLFETGTPTPAVPSLATSPAKPVAKPVVKTVVPAPAVKPPVAAVPAKPVEKPVIVTVSPAAAITAASVDANGDTPTQAAARQALAQKLFETSTPTAAAVTPPVASPAKLVEKPATPTTSPASATCCTAAPADANGDTPAQAAARQALAKTLFEAGTAAPVAGTAEKPKAKIGKDELPPIPAPVSPLPATKEAKLAALLIQYKADQISPADYHKQRAAILAQP